MEPSLQIAVTDDYQQVAFQMADWSPIKKRASVTVLSDHVSGEKDVIARLLPFTILCVMRERTPLTRPILAALPNLKLIVSTGKRNASIDAEACSALGIELQHTGYLESGAPEMTWALLMAISRHLVTENMNFRSGQWQTTIGLDLKGKTIGIVGLGRIGKKIAQYAKAFDMNVIAWSQNLTKEKAAESGVHYVTKDDLFKQSDYITLHLVLSERSRGIVTAAELSLMKSTAILINTSRGPLIEEPALIDALLHKRIAGAALDVYDVEPLPADHPLRKLDNVLATPHIGFVTEETYRIFFGDTVQAIEQWLAR